MRTELSEVQKELQKLDGSNLARLMMNPAALTGLLHKVLVLVESVVSEVEKHDREFQKLKEVGVYGKSK